MNIQVKICGITNDADAQSAAGCGADVIGCVVDIAYSPRSISVDKAATIIAGSSVPVILLFEKPCGEIKKRLPHPRPYGIQLVGDCTARDIQELKRDTGCAVLKTVHIPKGGKGAAVDDILMQLRQYAEAGADLIVLDALVRHKRGGTGQTCDWGAAGSIVRASPVPVFLAGGITPSNVLDALHQVGPQGVDVSSGVEAQPGRKDPEKMALLIRSVRSLEQ